MLDLRYRPAKFFSLDTYHQFKYLITEMTENYCSKNKDRLLCVFREIQYTPPPSILLELISNTFIPVLQPIKENAKQGDFKTIASHMCDFLNQKVVELEAAIVSTY